MNIFCAVSIARVYGSLSFVEIIVTGHVYLDVLEHFLVPQMDVNIVIWQQDGAPPSSIKGM
jgi:hypothetical protein